MNYSARKTRCMETLHLTVQLHQHLQQYLGRTKLIARLYAGFSFNLSTLYICTVNENPIKRFTLTSPTRNLILA